MFGLQPRPNRVERKDVSETPPGPWVPQQPPVPQPPPVPQQPPVPVTPPRPAGYETGPPQLGVPAYLPGVPGAPTHPQASVGALSSPSPKTAKQAGNWRRFFGSWLNGAAVGAGSQVMVAFAGLGDTPAIFEVDPVTGLPREDAVDGWVRINPITGREEFYWGGVWDDVGQFVILVFVLWVIGWLLAKVLLDIWGASKWGGKVGHLATSLRIADHHTSQPASVAQIRKRGITEMIFSILIPIAVLVWIFDAVVVLFSSERRRVVDRIAGTRIVEFVD